MFSRAFKFVFNLIHYLISFVQASWRKPTASSAKAIDIKPIPAGGYNFLEKDPSINNNNVVIEKTKKTEDLLDLMEKGWFGTVHTYAARTCYRFEKKEAKKEAMNPKMDNVLKRQVL